MKLENGLNFIAPFGKADIKGYHITSKLVVKLMDECGLDVCLINMDGHVIPEFEDLQKKDPKGRFNLLREIPTVDPFADGYYTVTEFDQPTWGSIPLLMKSKFTITESEFCKSVFSEFTKNEIGIIQPPLTPEFKPDGKKAKFNSEIDDFGFKFLAVFEWVMRKDPYTLIRAFCEEFKPDEDVCLILRAYSPREDIRFWLGRLAKNHNVFWLKDKIEDISTLYRACDCQVSATLGEGFGRTYVEAMACGMVNILPNATAIKEYANMSNALMVNCKQGWVDNRINELPHLIGGWFKVQVPDYDQLRAAMRTAFEQDCSVFGKNATKIRERFTVDNTKKQIKEVFEL